MRAFTKILASSVLFGSSSPAFSTSGQVGPAGTAIASQAGSISVFGSPGSQGGPTATQYGCGIALQGLFGVIGTSGSSANYGCTFNLLGSNTNEKSTFAIIKSNTVATTGPSILIDSSPWYRFVDFQIVPSSVGAYQAFATVILNEKGNF